MDQTKSQKITKKAPLTPLVVKWEDAVHDNTYDGTAEDAGETQICVAIGYLVKKTKKMLVLAGEVDEKGENVRFTISIPTSLVREIIELKGFSRQNLAS